ncbi:hypothetical protein H0H92_012891 [Tricholoma furcatifolium]|nr:hypothetical protein H0H92_012891 [Tricholoma furcatifolium]
MSSTNRPRPRPRPKPKAVTETQDASAEGSSSSTPLKTVQPLVVDDDDMFIRNRNRSTNTWAALEKLTKEVKPIHVDSDSDDGPATPKRKKPRKKEGAASPWQNRKHLSSLFSAAEFPDSDEEENEDEIEIVGVNATPRESRAKRKRPRSKSRSITPPPELPRHQLQQMRAIVEKTLNATIPISIRDDDDDLTVETEFSNPQLARLAKSVASRPVYASSPAPEGTDVVEISVKWKPHPLNPSGKEDLWVFRMNRDDNFDQLFEATAEEANIRVENLVLSYSGKRIYSSVTPMALSIWGDAELGESRLSCIPQSDESSDTTLSVGCDKGTYEYLRTHPQDTVSPTEDGPPDTDAPPSSQDQDDDKDQDSEAEGETFRLILRSTASTKDITLTVRPTTKCGAIVKAYLKKAGVAEQYPSLFAEADSSAAAKRGKGKKAQEEKIPKLCVDGERMDNDTEISEADLEDGDLVEVVGL